MRSSVLCRERLQRIQRVLGGISGQAMSVRDLRRAHGVDKWELEQAAELGWVEITLRRPPTGRPSRVAALAGVNKSGAAKLPPYRRDIPRSLSHRHVMFPDRYWCKGGLSGIAGPQGHGSASRAYAAVYGRGGDTPRSPAGLKSAGARPARQSWIRAGWLLRCRLDVSPGHCRMPARIYPADLRTRGEEWLKLLQALDREFRCGWPQDVSHAVAEARTIEAAAEKLAGLPRFSIPAECKNRGAVFIC